MKVKSTEDRMAFRCNAAGVSQIVTAWYYKCNDICMYTHTLLKVFRSINLV